MTPDHPNNPNTLRGRMIARIVEHVTALELNGNRTGVDLRTLGGKTDEELRNIGIELANRRSRTVENE
jgi:hypothetical protein